MVRFKAITHVRTYMEIVEQISKMIREKELLPGERLPGERTLAAELGIGRQCLREALSVLEVLGLIEVKKGRGSFVCQDVDEKLDAKDLNVEEVGDPFAMIEARKTIEVRTAFLAAKMAQRHDIEELDRLIAEMAEMTKRGEHASEQDKKLHLTIARASYNPVFDKLMNVVIANMGKRLWRILKEKSLLVQGRNERYHDEHVKLVEAIKNGDSRLAEKLMTQHLNGIEHDLRY